MPQILVINCGSSSLKYQYIETDTGQVLAKGLIGKIGEAIGQREYSSEKLSISDTMAIPDHTAALLNAMESLAHSGFDFAVDPPAAIGHRVVNGGPHLGAPVLIDDTVIELLRQAIPLAPLHNPANIVGIETCGKILSQVPQVAVFDTGFFTDLPLAHRTYAIPEKYIIQYGIRRYGFHGTSHEFVSRQAAEILQKPYTQLNQIVFHLGNGASVSAIRQGKPIDTSMGLTPLEGLVMGTRSGDIDPAIVSFLAKAENLDPDQIQKILNSESGLKGICGSNDMREVRELQLSGDLDADLAIKIFVHRARKYLGAYWLELDHLDTIIFTAGIGENADWLRAEVLHDLTAWGVVLDAELNNSSARTGRIISAPESAVQVMVIPTNEELMIALATVVEYQKASNYNYAIRME